MSTSVFCHKSISTAIQHAAANGDMFVLHPPAPGTTVFHHRMTKGYRRHHCFFTRRSPLFAREMEIRGHV